MAKQPTTPSTPSAPDVLDDTYVTTVLKGQLLNYRTDISERNSYIEQRDYFLYGTGLHDTADIPDGFDTTEYNFLRRIVEIYAAQLMGQTPNFRSYYYKEDIATFKRDDPQRQLIMLQNQQRAAKADARSRLIQTIIRDNGGRRLLSDGAQTGSAYGGTVYQMYWSDKEKRIVINQIESLQNWYPVWADTNFRKRNGDCFIIQMDKNEADETYGSYLKDGEQFPTSFAGQPLVDINGNNSSSLGQQGETVSSGYTRRPMVTKMNWSGILPGIKYDRKGNFVECETGQETKLNFTVVGNTIVSKITDPKKMSRLYYVPNKTVPRRPYGESDISQSSIEIVVTLMEMMSAQITLANKTNFPLVQGIGFEEGSIPPRRQKEITVLPMTSDQKLEPVALTGQGEMNYEKIIAQLMDILVKITGIGHVLFDALPTSGNNSNAALITTMRSMSDAISQKQKIWEPVLCEMFEDALDLAMLQDKTIREVIQDDEETFLYMEWPSMLRQDDPVHQTMLLNDLQRGAISLETYMAKRGHVDPGEEIARLNSELEDKTTAAILGGKLPELAQFAIFEAMGLPPWGFNPPHLSITGVMTPEQEANMAQNMGWNTGPYGGSIGPQGREGTNANMNWVNEGLIDYVNANKIGGPYAKYGIPQGLPPDGINPAGQVEGPSGQPGAPQAPGQMQGNPGSPIMQPPDAGPQPVSQPGSPAVSTPAGATRQVNQRHGG